MSDDREDYKFWIEAIEAQEKNVKDYYKRADDIERRYRQEHSSDYETSYNVLWSNTQTILPLLYNRTPIVNVKTGGNRSMIARKASRLMEDTIISQVELDRNFNDKMEDAVLDFALVGEGQLRAIYDNITEDRDMVDGVSGVESKVEVTLFESVKSGYVSYRDVLFIGSNKWETLPAIAYKAMYDRKELIDLFGEEIGGAVILDKTDDSLPSKYKNKKKDDVPERYRRAIVWEVWDKEKREVLFLSSGYRDKIMERNEDPLRLKDFFSMPKPMFSVTTNESLIPVPFFKYYEDQQRELDLLSTRIENLTNELKFRGAYNSSADGAKAIYDSGDGIFQPVEDMEAFTSQGGIDGLFFVVPIDQIASVIASLQKDREQVKQNIYEITGLADIIRAQSDPRETLGAQELKGKFGTLRISRSQKIVQRFARDLFALFGEIIIRNFEDTSVAIAIGAQDEKEILEVNETMAYLREQIDFGVVIDIETDSTISANEENSQEDAVQFADVIDRLAQQMQVLLPVFGEEWVEAYVTEQTKAFNQTKALDDALKNRIEQIKQQKNQPKEEEPPTAEEIEMIKLTMQQQQDQADNQLRMIELQLKQQQLELDAQKAGIDMQSKEQELDFKKTQTVIDNQVKLSEVEQKALIEGEKLDLEREKLEAEKANPDDNAVVGV